ncbi:MAG: acylphosphatase [Saprospiraceae bacterium]|nr:acylphosphatase [Saprospiraceae bacterium]
MTRCRRIQVKGKVQGVWFRASTKIKAEELALTGTVQNEEDGSVLIRAYGPSRDLDTLEEWCHEGPPHAVVLEVIASKCAPGEHPIAFTIVR